MYTDRAVSWILSSILLVSLATGCSGQGCGAIRPLVNSIPVEQRVRGGAQVRVTSAGFGKLKSIATAVLSDVFADGVCLPPGKLNLKVADATYCKKGSGGCDSGCRVNFNVENIDFAAVDSHLLQVHGTFNADGQVDVVAKDKLFGAKILDCKGKVSIDHGHATLNFHLNTHPISGALQVELATIEELALDDLNVDGCGGVTDFVLNTLISGLNGLINSRIGEFAKEELRPAADKVLQAFLPKPLGFEGILDLRPILSAIEVSPETREPPELELSVIPGGEVSLVNSGISLGIMTAFNSDRDPSTRGSGFTSEAAACVPPFPAPNLAEGPGFLPKATDGSFRLPLNGTFLGSPEIKKADVLVGASEALMNQIAHYITASGALCLEFGPEKIPSLRLGTVGIILPSLAELGNRDGSNPLLIRTRPTRPITARVQNTATGTPGIELFFDNFEVDIYAFLEQRYLRALTVSFDLRLNFAIEFGVAPDGSSTILPVLSGFDSAEDFRVLNSDLLREEPELIQAALPTIVAVILPQLGRGAREIALPGFAGFQLTGLAFHRMDTSQGRFLAVSGSLAPTKHLAALGNEFPSAEEALSRMEPPPAVVPVAAKARVVGVKNPTLQRATKLGAVGAATIDLEVSTSDDMRRPIEWTWRIGDGAWRPFVRGPVIRLSDPALALDGQHQVELRSRVVGDYRTISQEPLKFPVTIDRQPPTIRVEEARVEDGMLQVPITDLASQDAVVFAFGREGDSEPLTKFSAEAISVKRAQELSRGGVLQVWARDGLGNESRESLDLKTIGVAAGDNGGCSSGGGNGFVLAALFALLVLMHRPRRMAAPAALVLIAFLASCAGDKEEICERCRDKSDDPSCICEPDDLPLGRIGGGLDMSVAPDGAAWISAYSVMYGDLVVARFDGQGRLPDSAWQFVDGFPSGSLDLSLPRGGQRTPGENVGITSRIAVSTEGVPYVAYAASTAKELRLAYKRGESFSTCVVDGGGAVEAGAHVALLLDRNGLPAIAYQALVTKDGVPVTEVRYAQATNAAPTGPADFTIETVDALPLDDLVEFSSGTGYFVDAALRGADPVLAYYDASNGDLIVAERKADAWVKLIVDGTKSNVGWAPSLLSDANGALHLSYVDLDQRVLTYRDLGANLPEVVDDGARLEGQTESGLPKRVFHFVGDDSSLVLGPKGPLIAYQDSSSHELRVARRQSNTWTHQPVSGHEDSQPGAYGFFNAATLQKNVLWVATGVLDLPNEAGWIELFKIPTP